MASKQKCGVVIVRFLFVGFLACGGCETADTAGRTSESDTNNKSLEDLLYSIARPFAHGDPGWDYAAPDNKLSR
jgi:hypothetical protein